MKTDSVKEHVLALLKERGTIRYNEHFYRNGDADLWKALCAKYGVEENDGGEESPPILADNAVWGLKKAGLVETRAVPERMGDGEHDYEITLTQKGREFLAAR